MNKDFGFKITTTPGTPSENMTEEQLEYMRQEISKIVSEELEKHASKEDEE